MYDLIKKYGIRKVDANFIADYKKATNHIYPNDGKKYLTKEHYIYFKNNLYEEFKKAFINDIHYFSMHQIYYFESLDVKKYFALYIQFGINKTVAFLDDMCIDICKRLAPTGYSYYSDDIKMIANFKFNISSDYAQKTFKYFSKIT